MTTAKREDWLDIAKGILIICVVMGHYGTVEDGSVPMWDKYLYWFHMPGFFIISGYLLRKPKDSGEFIHFIKKRIYRLLVPYFSFLVLITLIRYIVEQHSFRFIAVDFPKLLYGGEFLGGLYAPFWFITCLFVSQLLFAFLLMKTKSPKQMAGWLIFFYLAAYGESYFFARPSWPLPFNMDVSFIAIIYLAMGYYGRGWLNKLKAKHSVGLAVLCLGFIASDQSGMIDYTLNLKYVVYHGFLLNLLIPLVFSLFIFAISKWISTTNSKGWLLLLGSTSLTIMYVHVPMNVILHHYFHYGYGMFVVIGLVVSVAIFKLLFSRFTVTRKLFLGEMK